MKKTTMKRIMMSMASAAMAATLICTTGTTKAMAGACTPLAECGRTVSKGSYSAVTNKSADELVASLLGDGVTVTSAEKKTQCDQNIGYASGAMSLFGIEQGVILSSAHVNDNGDSGKDQNSDSPYWDADLAQTLQVETETETQPEGYKIGGDISSLKFTMTASGTLLNFRYAFASCEFDQDPKYNDIFGLYVSVNGSAFENIALLPEGDPDVEGKAVTITNLRQGNETIDLCADREYLYFYGASKEDCGYNGVSKIFTAQKEVTVGDTVTVKFVIADVTDTGFGSAVIIEAGSLSFNPPDAGTGYTTETLNDFEPGVYKITDDTDTYTFTVGADGRIPLEGTDDGGKEYSFIGKPLTYVQVIGDEQSEPAEMTVDERPDAPDALEAREAATTSTKIGIIGAIEGNEYFAVKKGTAVTDDMWSKAVKYSGGSVPVLTKDAKGDSISEGIYTVYSRVAASSENFKSDISEPSEDIVCHDHVWVVTADDYTVSVTCTKSTPACCCYHEIAADASIMVKSGTVSDYRAYIDIEEEWSILGLPEFTFMYGNANDEDDEDVPKTATKPTTEGRWNAYGTVVINGVSYTIIGTFTIDSEGNVHGYEEVSALADADPSYLNRAYGYIIYEARAHALRHATDENDNELENTYLDMTEEKIYTDMNVVCYTLTGTTWKTGDLATLNGQLSKAFVNQTKIKIADAYDSAKKKPASDAHVYSFGTIKRRDETNRFTVNYYLCRELNGTTNGQWCLTNQKGIGVNLDTYEIGICDDGKSIGTKGYGVWPADGIFPTCGGVWVSNAPVSGKVGKEIYLYRKIATEDSLASKPVKITVTTVQAAPNIKVNYSTESLKLKQGMSIYFGNKLPEGKSATENIKKLSSEATRFRDYNGHAIYNITLNESKKQITISPYITTTRNNVFIWQTATAKKAATQVQTITLAARKSTPAAADIVTLKDGRAKLAKNWQVKVNGKWTTSIPVLKSDKTYELRFKGDAKGGKESDTTFAATDGWQLKLTYGVYDETKKSNNKGAVSAEIIEK